MKRCFKCNQEKPLNAFYKHPMMGDGHLNKCKECTKADTIKNRMAKIEHYRAYDRARASLPHRLAKSKEIVKRWAATFPERKRAQTAVHNAIRDKRLIPWPVCALPECDQKPEAHHPDYSRPLEVVWLCSAHHHQAHALYKKAA